MKERRPMKFLDQVSEPEDTAAEQLRQMVPGWEAMLSAANSFAGSSESSSLRVLGVVLGSGLGGLADRIDAVATVRFDRLAGLAASTAAGHRGEFILGRIGQTPTIAMAGRLHFYEGHRLVDVTRPIRVLAAMGVTDLIVSCAAGGLNPRFSTGDLCLIDERISWLGGAMGARVLPADDIAVGCSVPVPMPPVPMPRARPSGELAAWADEAARAAGLRLHRGTYLAVNGPNYETRAECRMMRTMGVDLVGMSTVPELIAASALGLNPLAIGVITNMAIPDAVAAASHAEVLVVSRRAGEGLQRIVVEIAARLRTPSRSGSC